MLPDTGFPVTEGLLQPFGYGRGYQDFIPLAAPAAGANLVFTVESRNLIRVLGARCNVTTDANVANRFVALDFINARGQTMMRNAVATVVVGSTTNLKFEWSAQRADGAFVANCPVLAPVFPLFLSPGSTVQFTLDSIQVGDQISLASLVVERYDTGPTGYPLGFIPDTPVAPPASG
jgi:hypothetical protein